MARNCRERILNTFGMALSKKNAITATEVVLIQFFSYNVVSKQRIKMKTKNTMAPSYHSKLTSNQNKKVPFFSCLGHRV